MGAAARSGIAAGEAFALWQTIVTYHRAIGATDFDRRPRELEEARDATAARGGPRTCPTIKTIAGHARPGRKALVNVCGLSCDA